MHLSRLDYITAPLAPRFPIYLAAKYYYKCAKHMCISISVDNRSVIGGT